MDANETGRGYQAAMSKTIVRVLREYTGRGPTKARAIIGRDGVMVVIGGHHDDGRTPAGRTSRRCRRM